MFDFTDKTLEKYADAVEHQQLVWPALDKYGVEVYLRRDDSASEHYPGNKFYKLFFNLRSVLASNMSTVVSFGGAYSNHIHALAMMGKQYQLATVGVIRGHRPAILSPTLQDAQACGMELLFLGYEAYKKKDLGEYGEYLHQKYGEYFLLPEGGETLLGVEGCKAIGASIARRFSGDYSVCTALGTGTTMSGIVAGLPSDKRCIGFSVLKGEDRLTASIQAWLSELGCSRQQWQVITGFHHGGYAKVSAELLAFMTDLEARNNVLLEPVYSAKMLWGIGQLAQQGFWPKGSQIIAVHGGGLQGRRGFGL